MTKYQFHVQRLNALDCATADQYIAECGGSMPEEYFDECVDIVSAMQQIWDLAHDFTFRRLHDIHGCSLQALSREYEIPIRTLEEWNAGHRTPPEYVLELLCADVLSNQIPMETYNT